MAGLTDQVSRESDTSAAASATPDAVGRTVTRAPLGRPSYGASYGLPGQPGPGGPALTTGQFLTAGQAATGSAGQPFQALAHATVSAHGAPSASGSAVLGGPSGVPPVGQATGGPATAGPLTSSPPRKLSGRRRRETVAVLIFGGAPIFESSIPLSVFGVDRQDAGVPRYRLLVCAGEEGPLATTGGLTLTAPYGLEALARAGTIVVPAWRSISQPPPVEAIAALRKAHHEGARIIGLCTGAFVLAAAGLLDGRPATTHWMYAPTLAKRYPRVHVDPRELFVDDGDVLTSAGTAAGIDLCLHVVRSDHGAEAANALARRLVVPSRRSGGGQAQYIDQSLPEEIGNDPLAEVVTWALENLNQQFDVEVLAARAYMSRRTFDRRFRTLTGSAPLQWLITQRVLQAQRLLETSELSVDDVARRCGFRSPVALRGHFRRQLGVSPAAYRTSYRARRPGPQASGPAPGTSERFAGGSGGPQPGQAGHAGQAVGQPGPYGHPGHAHPAPGAGAAGTGHASGTGAPGHSGHGTAVPSGQAAQGGVPHQGQPARQPYQNHAGQPAGGRNGGRALVPAQAGPASPRPPRTVEHAPAEDGQPQPGARGQGQGHRAGRASAERVPTDRAAMDRSGPDRGTPDRAAADRSATGRGTAEHTSADQDGHGPAGPGYAAAEHVPDHAAGHTPAGHAPEDGVAEGRTATDRGAPNGASTHAPAADRVPAPAPPADDGIGGSASREGLAVPAARDRAVG
ncbi:hypothetical protein GCM10018781_31280 [Kitasatospora indigofera]|uniref:HTH araC/xylS-type domain-containing protein n=1 Tax=Kitasatospora indigofera TaxID=67307 RepID=A0A919FSW7_9ACTN|nr:hypothetical protein GCM10018781_31280 [Kitasatospora indigofera]